MKWLWNCRAGPRGCGLVLQRHARGGGTLWILRKQLQLYPFDSSGKGAPFWALLFMLPLSKPSQRSSVWPQRMTWMEQSRAPYQVTHARGILSKGMKMVNIFLLTFQPFLLLKEDNQGMLLNRVFSFLHFSAHLIFKKEDWKCQGTAVAYQVRLPPTALACQRSASPAPC